MISNFFRWFWGGKFGLARWWATAMVTSMTVVWFFGGYWGLGWAVFFTMFTMPVYGRYNKKS